MKTVSSIARILLGALFAVFGLNGFLHFIPMGPAPAGLAGQYLGALFESHYLSVVFAIELITALLLLSNRYVPLALSVLAAILVNILLFHTLMAPAGIPLAVFALILWIAAVWNVRATFAGLLQSRVEPQSVDTSRSGSNGLKAGAFGVTD